MLPCVHPNCELAIAIILLMQVCYIARQQCIYMIVRRMCGGLIYAIIVTDWSVAGQVGRCITYRETYTALWEILQSLSGSQGGASDYEREALHCG